MVTNGRQTTQEKRAYIQSQMDEPNSKMFWLEMELSHARDFKAIREYLKRSKVRAYTHYGFPVVYKNGDNFKVCVIRRKRNISADIPAYINSNIMRLNAYTMRAIL